jgi:putative FmdB family regulatory protein
MPIYEFYCAPCHRIFNFLSRGVDTNAAPACPKCGRTPLQRRVSSFAISKNRAEPKAAAEPGADELPPGFDEQKLMRAMEELGPELESMNDEDPRQAAQLMRRLFGATGMPVGRSMEEALRRMEAGEDPEKVEEDMGELLEQDPFLGAFAGGEGDAGEPGAARKGRLAALRRQLPPSVDQTLYEM